jgi:hypothetical protein
MAKRGEGRGRVEREEVQATSARGAPLGVTRSHASEGRA